MTSSTRTAGRRHSPVPVDLESLRLRNEAVVAAVAGAPVRHLPAELLDALLGSWGTTEELGLTAPTRMRLVAG